MRANLIAVLVVLLLAPLVGADGGGEEAEVEVSVEAWLRELGEQQGRLIVIDEALRGKRVRFLGDPAELMGLDVAMAVLGTFGVEIVLEQIDGRLLMKTYLQRSLDGGIPVATPFYLEGEGIGPEDQIITAVVPVDPGAADRLVAALKERMVRDPRRVGSVARIPGRDAIVVTDVRKAALDYIRLARASTPAARLAAQRDAEVDVEAWLRDLGAQELKVVVIDEALRGKRVRFLGRAPKTADRATIQAVLETRGVRIVEGVFDGQPFLNSAPVPHFGRGASFDPADPIVSAVVPVGPGAARWLAAALRAHARFDRAGWESVQCVPGRDVVVISDRRSSAIATVWLLHTLNRLSFPGFVP